jgi:hypothetical protein
VGVKKFLFITVAIAVFLVIGPYLYLTKPTSADQFNLNHHPDSPGVDLWSFHGIDQHVVIPRSVKMPVSITSWLGGEFTRRTGIKSILSSVTIPKSVQRLGNAFSGCTRI